MNRVDISKLVCMSDQSLRLLELGMDPLGALCYSKDGEEYEFAGEYIGEPDCIPAWTYEELCVMIGGDYSKPDVLGIKDFTPLGVLPYFRFYLHEKCHDYPNGARAAAHMLIYMLENKVSEVKEINERYEKFYSKPF